MSHIVLSVDGAVVYDSQPQQPAAGSSIEPLPSGEPGGDYSTVLVPPGGHGLKFRPGITRFDVPDVQPGQTVEISIVCNGGDVPLSLSDPSGQVVGDWIVAGIGTVRSVALAGGAYSLTVNAPNYGEINHWRHP